MVCYTPLRAYRRTSIKGSEIKFNVPASETSKYLKLDLACGQCIGCRIDRSRAWALRCVHEASLYYYNTFITLTYDDQHMPDNAGLRKKDFQNFMKELRRKYIGKTRNDGKKMPEQIKTIRFFQCGEYGEACRYCGYDRSNCICSEYVPGLGRPHHHAILFNFDFPDKVLEAKKKDYCEYSSEILDKLWKKGLHSIGEVSFKSAAYCARYVTKKITGPKAKDHYQKVDYRTGAVYQVEPEYITMSRRPGIGYDWYQKYKSDCYPKDHLTTEGKYIKVPKYYDKQYEIEYPIKYEEIKEDRRLRAIEFPERSDPERLRAGHKIKEKQVQQLIRRL